MAALVSDGTDHLYPKSFDTLRINPTPPKTFRIRPKKGNATSGIQCSDPYAMLIRMNARIPEKRPNGNDRTTPLSGKTLIARIANAGVMAKKTFRRQLK